MEELDELNKKVLEAQGWKLGVCEVYQQGGVTVWYAPNGDTCDLLDAPRYDDDIAAAWELVEETQAEPYEQAFELHRSPAITRLWVASIGRHACTGATPAEAISRAWLAWKEAQA